MDRLEWFRVFSFIQFLLMLINLRFSASTDVLNLTGVSRRRITRMSVLDFWARQTQGDGINLRWGHHVNSWPVLREHLQDPQLQKSMLIEGDVYLSDSRSNRVPVMAIPPTHTITFKEWINQVSTAIIAKAIKINIKTTEAVIPALTHLDVYSSGIRSPIIIHADIMKGPKSSKRPIDPGRFTSEVKERFPDATVSVGWTNSNVTVFDQQNLRYSWRRLFDMLEYTYPLHQPVMYTISASHASNSLHELLWLLGVRSDFSLLIKAHANESISNWQGLVALRKFGNHRQILYDFSDDHRETLIMSSEKIGAKVFKEETPWNPSAWRVVQFLNPSRILSTIIASKEAPAFLGWPTAFLHSLHTPLHAGTQQTVSGRVLFVPKRNFNEINQGVYTGVAIYLLESVRFIDSPSLDDRGGVKIFIGFRGRVSIERQAIARRRSYKKRRRQRQLSKAVSQLLSHDCYGFSIRDGDTFVEILAFLTRCTGSAIAPPPNSYTRRLTLRVPAARTGRQRYVLIQKTGDGTVDTVIQDLYHANGAVLPARPRWRAVVLAHIFAALLSVRPS